MANCFPVLDIINSKGIENMCGIFGWQLNDRVGPTTPAILGSVLGCKMSMRGTDSWGRVDVLRGKIQRGLGDISKRQSSWYNGRLCVIGHTRRATTVAP